MRLQHHGARDGDALALAAGEFVRIAVRGRRIEPDLLERLRDLAVALGLRERSGAWIFSPSPTMSPTDMRGLSEP